jgi:catechol 2,3-dioxygenase-like lactoylglutathione lyase family enzyme
MILGVHHVQLSISTGAEDQAREFYCKLLGFQEVPKPENLKDRGGFWMQLSNLHVHVGTEDGFEAKEGSPIPGYARFECRDPFGNRVEFIEPLHA